MAETVKRHKIQRVAKLIQSALIDKIDQKPKLGLKVSSDQTSENSETQVKLDKLAELTYLPPNYALFRSVTLKKVFSSVCS